MIINITPKQLANKEYMLSIESFIDEQLLSFPDDPDVPLMKGTLELHKGNYELAEHYIKYHMGLQPKLAGSVVPLSAIYSATGRYWESLSILEHGYSLSKDCPSLNWNYSLALIQKGDFELGWNLYRYRKLFLEGQRRMIEPEWDGTGWTEGKSILIFNEQGLGDAIMFFRYVKQLKEKFGFSKVYLETVPSLYGLFFNNTENQIDNVYLCPMDFHLPFKTDYHVSICDLPYVCRISKWDSTPYIKSNPSITEGWKSAFNDVKEKKIGLVWNGSSGHANDANRSADINQMKPFKQLGKLISLNPNPIGEPDFDLSSMGQGLANMEYTAAALSHMDLLITVDTAIAHLAGAMGIPTYLMLPYAQEWRWGMCEQYINKKSPSFCGYAPQYSSVRMYRQLKPKSWDQVIKDITEDIKCQ